MQLYSYITKKVLRNILFLSIIIVFIIFIIDYLEALKKDADSSLILLLKTSLMSSYQYFNKALPFIVFIGVIITYGMLAKRMELVSMKAAGYSSLQLAYPVIASAIICSFINIFLLNPIGVYMYKSIERGKKHNISMSGNNIWIKHQSENKRYIINGIKYKDSPIIKNIYITVLSIEGMLESQIIAQEGIINDSSITMQDVKLIDLSNNIQNTQEMTLSIGIANIAITPIHGISIWEILPFISSLKTMGLQYRNYLAHFYSIVLSPILLISMAILGMSISTGTPRVINTSRNILLGITFGFVVYLFIDVVTAIGVTSGIPVLISTAIPILICLALSIYSLLHYEYTI